MKVGILGATGQVGSHVLRAALEKGYEVRLLVRDPAKLGLEVEQSEVVVGSIEDPAVVQSALYGCDAVLNAAGGIKASNQYKVFKEGTQNIIDAMRKHGIKRLVSINGAASIIPGEYVSLKRRMVRLFVLMLVKFMVDAKAAEYKVLSQSMDIDWSMVRAPVLVDEKGSGELLIDERDMAGGKVMLEDLARFMVSQLDDRTWIHKAPFVAS
ncbi:MAG: NAD(P)H-binding protein [Gammaproteobacteria bacterium]|nr:NAD(P)H-binding protein [Gammaproteobacteria bacterium]